MTLRLGTSVLSVATLLAVNAGHLEAQTCLGAPPRGGIAYQYGMMSLAKSNGIDARYAWSHTSLGLSGRLISGQNGVDSKAGDFQFAVHIPVQRVMVCPTIGVGYLQNTWKPQPDFSVDMKRAALRAGVGIGYEQPVYKSLSLIPYLAGRYEFHVVYYDTNVPEDAETSISGDTLSGVDIEYGLVARYNIAYLGYSVQRSSITKSDRPYQARISFGVTFPLADVGRSRNP